MTPNDEPADSGNRPEQQVKRYTIRFTIMTTFLVVSGLVAFVALVLHYIFSLKLVEEEASALFVEIGEKSAQRVLELERRGINLTHAMQTNPITHGSALGFDSHHLHRQLARLMREGDGIFSLFTGYPNGDYLEISNLEASTGVRAAWDASAGDRWVITKITNIDGQRIKQTHFLDQNFRTRLITKEESNFLPYDRPWFQKATTESVYKTTPYLLSFVRQPGISYSIKTENGAVTGAVTLLSSVEQLLANKKYPETSHSYVFDQSGFISARHLGRKHQQNVSSQASMAKSDSAGSHEVLVLDQLPHPDLLAYARNEKLHHRLGRVNVAGHENYLFVSQIEGFEDSTRQEYIGLLVEQQEVIGPYKKQLVVSTFFIFGLLLLLLPFISFTVRLLVNPINRLITENNKVRNREYGQVRYVPTVIHELHQLSGSLVSMSQSICDYAQAQQDLLDAFIQLIAQAIDDKSPYTGAHCERVPRLAELLAEAACKQQEGPFKNFAFTTEEEWREFRVAAWLHDCGKIITPESIVDKGSKLEAIYNRIHEIRMRFEVLLRDAEIQYWQNMKEQPERAEALKEELVKRQDQIRQDFAFVAACNVGGEFMDDEQLNRLKQIASQTWTRYLDNRLGLSPVEEMSVADCPESTPQQEQLLADKPEHITYRDDTTKYDGYGFTLMPPRVKQNLGEIYNLSIRRGTLTDEDRFIINEHIISTIRMLETLPLPEDLAKVPEYAGGHHEGINGKGYPRGLSGDALSTPARIMAIADIYEALTAGDRPYKKAKTLSQSLAILKSMVIEGHVDKDLFRLFIESGVYLTYANEHLRQEQIDDIDTNELLVGL